ncbi:DapH/DapD/GlmU-related protein [Filibacter tadaridae]|uniref:UDP-3-O-(3-hydroxymyristoyl)glucosamine N-acyltransferase n=1 Tax=Filibacter tadaridae TaxID=2483811 RepID=A0A3P5XFY3_9BACL|nr:DapH/DapD/GlmU-related protein [Filibacter tadaridae]VDC33695.1 UDP-3-O-(3-hydroxymyristoyl)glucosamine N-acyltransferase [Filibacter tadaridae]
MINIENITEFLDGTRIPYKYQGNKNLTIETYASIDNVKAKAISWIKDVEKMNSLVIEEIKESIIVSKEAENIGFEGLNFIYCENPKEVFFTILNHFFITETSKEYKSPNSVIESSHIGKGVYIGHNCYIGYNVVISDNVKIKNNVSIEGKVTIGKNSIISSGVIIGSDGFGYFQNDEGKNIKVPHFGGVTIGEDVEIGANTCIDRGTLNNTEIGNNVKVGNLCKIAHNVIIEENVSVISQSMIAGSVHLKKNSYIAPSVSIMNQITIGENSIVGLGTVVLKDVEDNVVVVGVPGKIIRRLEEDSL